MRNTMMAVIAALFVAQAGSPSMAPAAGQAPAQGDAQAPTQGAAEAPAKDAADANLSATHEQDGKYFTAEDVPTFKIADDGTVDWYTFSGFRRYHSECHVCHGPDGQGSSYAPALAKSALRMDYYDFVNVVVNGRVNGNSVMPSFGTNLNVMCYLDDIYVYLKAVGSEAIPRGRPQKKAEKPDAFTQAEDACMG